MFGQVIATEFIKLRRSKVVWLSLVAMSLGLLGVSLFMWIMLEPERAAQFGLLGTKAELTGLTATWPSYSSMVTLVVGIGGMLLLAFIVAYVFGREYADGTAKNILALPVGRQWFVLAKFAVVATWWLLLVMAVLAAALVLGLLLGLPGFSAGLAVDSARDALLAAGIAYLLAPPVAWITILGRGYLPALGFALSMLLLGNVLAKTGWAYWFPWSIVPLSMGMLGEPVGSLPVGSYLVLALTFVAGVLATILQTRYADNAQ